MKSIGSIHKKNNNQYEVYVLADMKFYDVEQDNIERFHFKLSEYLVFEYKTVSDKKVFINEVLSLNEERDLIFLMSFLNNSKGVLWDEIYKLTQHLINEDNFVPKKEFFQSANKMKEKDLSNLYNSVPLKFLIKNELLINKRLDLFITRLFNQIEHEDLTTGFKNKLTDFISDDVRLLNGISPLKLIEYRDLVPDKYIFDLIIKDSQSKAINNEASINIFIIQYISMNPQKFEVLMLSHYPIEYIYGELPDQLRYKYLNHIGRNQLIKLSLVDEYVRIIKKSPEKSKEIPIEYYEINSIFNLIPNQDKFVWAVRTNKPSRKQKELFHVLKDEEKKSVANIIPKSIVLDFPKYIRYLPDEIMREICFDEYESLWEHIPNRMKEKIILDTMKNDKDSDVLEKILYESREKDQLTKILIFILTFEKRFNGKHSFVKHEKIHKEIMRYFQEFVVNVQSLKNTMHLLPPCQLGKTFFCEVKTVKQAGNDDYSYCPRMRSKCDLEISSSFKEQDSDNWGYLEVFDKYGVEFILKDLDNPKEYVNKLAGYVNRLIELDEKMVCRICNERLIPNHKYSKFLASYNMTVAKCKNSKHENVYFNHCWNCYEIIDSRESTNQKGGYRLCRNCGAGVKDKNSPDYIEPGTTCPMCFHEGHKYTIDEYRRNNECLSCGHKILKNKELKHVPVV